MSIEDEILATQQKIIDTADKIINKYTDIETIKRPDFLWTEQEKNKNYDEIKMLAALKKYVMEQKKLPETEDDKSLLVNYFDVVTRLKGGSSSRRRRRIRKSKRRRSKRLRSRRATRRK